jgi:hypothetical protein
MEKSDQQKEIQQKMEASLQKVVNEEMESLKHLEGGLNTGEYNRLLMMLPLVLKRGFLEGFKTGCEVLGVDMNEK